MRTILAITLGLLVIVFATLSPAQTPEHLWSKGLGGFGNDVPFGVAVDASGNVVVVGDFQNAVDFGGGTFVSAGSRDIYVAKYDANGLHQWSKRFGSAGDDIGLNVAVDASGNVFVTGWFAGAVDFGGGNLVPSDGSYDIFLAEYNASGEHQWSQRFESAVGWAGPFGLAADGSGNVIVSGDFKGTVDLGGGNLVCAGGYDIFLAKYDASGTHQWSQRFGSTDDEFSPAVAVDGSGYVFVTGGFTGTVDFGGGNLVSSASGDVFLAKYDANGVHQWSRNFGGPASGSALAVDGSGNVVLTGGFEGTVNFGGGNIVSAGSTDIFLAKYTGNGVHLWSRPRGGSDFDLARGVAVDGAGNVLLTGEFRGTANFGETDLVSAGESDIFVAKYGGSSGANTYRQRFGGAGYDAGRAVAVDGSGNAVVVGHFQNAVDFGGGSVANGGGYDIFVAKYGDKPRISKITDVLFDNGLHVNINFFPSGHDGSGLDPLVTQYEAFRRNISPAGPPWVSVAQIPATMAGEYEMPVPTDADSTCGSGPHYSYYFIRAHTATPGVFFDSPIDSGYSVDNLAPGIPTNLTYAAGHLSWDASSAPDFDHFSVYGSNTNAFGSATFVNNTVTPGMNVAPPLYAFYFVTATDHSCNEGGPASVGTVTGVGGTPASYVLSLSAYPNPFNPETTIRYTLPTKGACDDRCVRCARRTCGQACRRGDTRGRVHGHMERP